MQELPPSNLGNRPYPFSSESCAVEKMVLGNLFGGLGQAGMFSEAVGKDARRELHHRMADGS
jgi:hypothetical protein